MVPPKQDIHAALYKWAIVGNYDSADQCFTDKAGFVGHAELRAIQRKKRVCPPIDDPYNEAQCIGTDDPRLKEK
jgi:hypothetical protein